MTYEKIERQERAKRWIKKHKEALGYCSAVLCVLIAYGVGINKGRKIQSDIDSLSILSFAGGEVNDLIKDICSRASGK